MKNYFFFNGSSKVKGENAPALSKHNNPKDLWKTNVVMSTCVIYLHTLGWWAQHHFQKLTSLVPTYLQDPCQLLDNLKQIGAVPGNAELFTVEAVSMYTNVYSTHAIEISAKILTLHHKQLPKQFPISTSLTLWRKICWESNGNSSCMYPCYHVLCLLQRKDTPLKELHQTSLYEKIYWW